MRCLYLAYDYMAERHLNRCKVCGQPCPDSRTVCWVCDKNVDSLIEYNKQQDALYSKPKEPEEPIEESECEACKIPPLDDENARRYSGLLEEE